MVRQARPCAKLWGKVASLPGDNIEGDKMSVLLPDPLPEEMTLHPSKMKWRIVSWIGAGFVTICILAIGLADEMDDFTSEDLMYAWAGLIFFGAVTIVGRLQMKSKKAKLVLRRDGFECGSLWKTITLAWSDVSEFSVISVAKVEFIPLKAVAFDHKGGLDSNLGKLNKTVSGATGSLPDNYGQPADYLAELMNAFRARALKS